MQGWDMSHPGFAAKAEGVRNWIPKRKKFQVDYKKISDLKIFSPTTLLIITILLTISLKQKIKNFPFSARLAFLFLIH